MNSSNRNGFTLVELVIVILIFGIIGAVILPKFWQAKQLAENATCLTNMHSIEAAVANYMINSIETNNTPEIPSSRDDLVTAGFLAYIPDCPKDESDYNYNSTNGAVTCNNHPR